MLSKLSDILNFKKLKLPVSKSGVLIVLGIVGILLILVSSFKPTAKKTVTVPKENETVTTDTYVQNTEKKLEQLISEMLGGTDVSVMMTLESGIEYVYADEQKIGAEIKKDQTSRKTEQNDSNHKTYVVIKDSDGNENALLVTEKMPIVRGVVVVCQSGQTEAVSSAVKSVIKSALNVDEDKICVIGRH